MTSILTGFADADAWMRTADGNIVGRARDRSYKEIVRSGVPIDRFMAVSTSGCCSEPVLASEPASEPTPVPEKQTECDPVNYVSDDDCEWDFDTYFSPSVPRRTARKARVAKMMKAAHKQKARSVAAKIFAEEPPACDHYIAPVKRCECCGSAQEFSGFPDRKALLCARACERCDPSWIAELSAWTSNYRATLAAAERERDELRLEQRIRYARYD